MPAILSLLPSAFKFYCEVPVVPILQLQDFLNQLSAYTENVQVFQQNLQQIKS